MEMMIELNICNDDECIQLSHKELVELKEELNKMPWLNKTKKVFAQKADDLYLQSLHILGLNKRAWNFFNNFDMKTIGDLMTYTRVDLQIFKGVGITTIRDIEQALAELDLILPNSVIPVEEL